MTHTPHPTKCAVRLEMRRRRKALTSDAVTQATKNLATQLCAQPWYATSLHIGVYHAQNGECDPCDFVRQAWEDGKQCYLPIIQAHHHMVYGPYAPETALHPNRFGIAEPDHPQATVDGKQLDIILVPVLAFNTSRQRLGNGQGYYDRHFASKKPSAPPRLIGLAYDWQHSDDWVADAWDLRCDDVCVVCSDVCATRSIQTGSPPAR